MPKVRPVRPGLDDLSLTSTYDGRNTYAAVGRRRRSARPQIPNSWLEDVNITVCPVHGSDDETVDAEALVGLSMDSIDDPTALTAGDRSTLNVADMTRMAEGCVCVGPNLRGAINEMGHDIRDVVRAVGTELRSIGGHAGGEFREAAEMLDAYGHALWGAVENLGPGIRGAVGPVIERARKAILEPSPLAPGLPPRRMKPVKADFSMAEELGKGAFGVVRKVKIKATAEWAAVKVVAGVKLKKHIQAIEREITVMRMLDHSNVVRLKDSFTVKHNDVYMIMELCSEGNLKEFIKKHPIDKSQIKFVLRDILKGLEHIHSKGVVHRDLKLDNVLVTDTGGIKIADFGFARQINPLAEKEGVRTRHYTPWVGTLYYMAPELLLRNYDYGFEVDMWSLGCIAGELFQKGHIMMGNINKTDANASAIEQIGAIERLCGDVEWVPWWIREKLPRDNPRKVIPHFMELTGGDEAAVNFIDKCLDVNQATRPSSSAMRLHSFFSKKPHPAGRFQIPPKP